MRIIVKPAFERDIDKVRNRALLHMLDDKINQIEKAGTIDNITGLKLLRTYKVHYRLKVETSLQQYRIGAVIRGKTIWLVRFLPRKKIYDY
jgi:mRNA-degrading endonuclease RelE of RelBE toxin-antitoxin system